MQQPLNASALSSCAAAASSAGKRSPKALLLFPQFPAPRLSAGPHVSYGSLSGSPSAPTRSSDLLRFWGEDPIGGGDRIAKQFWGDIFAKLPHSLCRSLTLTFLSRYVAPLKLKFREVDVRLTNRQDIDRSAGSPWIGFFYFAKLPSRGNSSHRHKTQSKNNWRSKRAI